MHLEAVESMLPLFFAANHVNYARDGLYYHRIMRRMPEYVRYHFMKGEHTVQQTSSIFAGLWSDMAIETSYMWFGHSSTGIVGQLLKPETIKTWAYSINSCCELAEGLEAMRNKDQEENTTHKEMKGRINKDDCSILRKKLETSIDIFDPSQH